MRLTEDMRKFYSWIEELASEIFQKKISELTAAAKKENLEGPIRSLAQEFIELKSEVDTDLNRLEEIKDQLRTYRYKTDNKVITDLVEIQERIEYKLDEELLERIIPHDVWLLITDQVREVNPEKLNKVFLEGKISKKVLKKVMDVNISNPIDIKDIK